MPNSSLPNNSNPSRFDVMPFGKHKGRELRSIPQAYLLWCRDSLTLEPALEAAIKAELFERSKRALVRLLNKSPDAAGRLKEHLTDLIRTAEQAGYGCGELKELLP